MIIRHLPLKLGTHLHLSEAVVNRQRDHGIPVAWHVGPALLVGLKPAAIMHRSLPLARTQLTNLAPRDFHRASVTGQRWLGTLRGPHVPFGRGLVCCSRDLLTTPPGFRPRSEPSPPLSSRSRSLSSKARGKGGAVFVCGDCGESTARWAGRCPSCGAWNTLKSFTPSSARAAQRAKAGRGALGGAGRGASATGWVDAEAGGAPDGAVPLPLVKRTSATRFPLRSKELSRLLGGGVVRGSVVLIAGTPGIGKSTLLLQLAALLIEGPPPSAVDERGSAEEESASDDEVDTGTGRVVYLSGEESAHQIKSRAGRLGIDSEDILLLNETDVEVALHHVERAKAQGGDLRGLIVDSVQTMWLADVPSAAGTPSQVRESSVRLMAFAKRHDVPVFLVGHVTKSGDIAGPKMLEHLVDTVLYVEGDTGHAFRLVRSVKNRFGSTAEVGVFEMGDQGLVEVENPASLFLTSRPLSSEEGDDDGEGEHESPGSAVTTTVEGTRSLCAEIQALCTDTPFEFPRHRANGVSLDRVFLLLAVLARHARLTSRGRDVFVNVVGGLRLSDPGTDLALAVAIASGMREVPVPRDVAFIGEIGLGGELRPVPHMKARIDAAAQMGFRKIVVPAQAPRGSGSDTGLPIHRLGHERGGGKTEVSRNAGPISAYGGRKDGSANIKVVPLPNIAAALRFALRKADSA